MTRSVDEEALAARYDLEAASPPPGIHVPNMFAYIRFKAFRYLAIGASKYRERDYFHFPAADWSQDRLDAVRRGCQQILQWRGTTPESPLEEIGVAGFYDLLCIFHFELHHRNTSKIGNGAFMDEMVMKHAVTSEEITLFNKVS